MTVYFRWLPIFAVNLAAIAVLFRAPGSDSDNETIKDCADRIVKSDEPSELYWVYPRLFRAAGRNGLSGLQTVTQNSIAIQAAWQEVELTVPAEFGKGRYKPSADRLNWFLGFFQARARVHPPAWWTDVLLNARANRRDNILPGNLPRELYHDTGINDVRCPIDDTVVEVDGVVKYRQRGKEITIPAEVFRGAENISALFTVENCYVALHGNLGGPHELICIVRKTNELKWRTRVCGCFLGGSSGPVESWVTVTKTEDGRVFVFGAGTIGLYAHGFSASDGTSLVYFSNGL